MNIPKVQVTKHTAFEVKEDPVLFSLADTLRLGQLLSAQGELAVVADRRGLVIIDVFPKAGLVLYIWAEGYCHGIKQGQRLLKTVWERSVTW